MRLPKHEFGVSEVGAEVEYLVFVFVLDYCVFPGSYEFIQLGCDVGVGEVGKHVEYFVFDFWFFLEFRNLSTLGMTLGSVRWVRRVNIEINFSVASSGIFGT